jgi:CheY-like chemotaxis protein
VKAVARLKSEEVERDKEGIEMSSNDETDVDKTGKSDRRILVADDDPAILRLVATILEKENFSVVTARDGREAYKTLQSDPNFTAAILDVVMPHISGPELVRFMKSERRLMRIPVMMMTAEQDPKLSSDSFSAGAVVFLPKPFTTAQLQIMLQMLIGKAA